MTYRTDAIYVEVDVHSITGETNWLFFHSPDGTGRIYHDTLEEAKDQTGLTKVIHLI